MTFRVLVLVLVCVWSVPLPSKADETNASVYARWLRAFDKVAADYKLARSDGQALALVDRATYTWARPGAHGGTYGGVYVWTNQGNVESVACFWRNPGRDGHASIVHELHLLSPVVLSSTGRDSDSWKPKAGVKRQLIEAAPVPAATGAGRLQQMRALCRDFSARSVSVRGERTELRLLTQPLYRSHSTNPEILDGALFAFVCSVGTDPEVFLQLEASNTPDGMRWHYTAARFSHMDLFVDYKNRPVWEAIRDAENPMAHNADQTYWVFHQPSDQMRFEEAP